MTGLIGPTPDAVYDDSLAPDGDASEEVLNVRGNFSVFLSF